MAPSRLIVGRALILGLGWLLAVQFLPCQAQVRSAVVKYPSGDQKITLECFVPTIPGKFPTVLLLHGSGGLEQATGPIYREIATAMARSGYVVLIPHFFEKTNHPIGKPLQGPDYTATLESLKDAMAYASRQPEVDPTRFAMIGYSMSSNMASILATQDTKIKAIASWSGAYPPIKPSKKLPPLLILHGSKDPSTPLKYVEQFEKGLTDQAMPHDMHIYNGMGHNFDYERFEDATVRTVAFFDKYVKVSDKTPR
jgi:carboxymethylenebutenolidase